MHLTLHEHDDDDEWYSFNMSAAISCGADNDSSLILGG